MKIALVSPYDYAYPGGVQTHIYQLARQYKKMGHRVLILAPFTKREMLLDNKDIIPLGNTVPYPSNASTAHITFSLWLIPKVKAILEREKFDVIHLHEPFCPLLTWLVLYFSQSVNVGTFHAYYERSIGYWIWKKPPFNYVFLNLILHKLHGRIAVSEAARGFVSRYFPGDYRLIPHGIEVEHFSAEVPPLEAFDDGKLNILFVSRLEKRKGLIHLLYAYKQVKREFPNCRLIVVGGGNKRIYQELAQEMKLKDVAFLGYVPYPELPRYYHTADIFCAPAIRGESFGIILLEAMAAGKPIIASNIKGYSGVLTHEVEGLLVPPKNKEALAQALLFLLNNPEARHQMGFRGRAKVEEYSWERISQRIMDYYWELLEEKRHETSH